MALHAIENAMRGPRTHGRMKFDLSVHENFFVSACASNNYNFFIVTYEFLETIPLVTFFFYDNNNFLIFFFFFLNLGVPRDNRRLSHS